MEEKEYKRGFKDAFGRPLHDDYPYRCVGPGWKGILDRGIQRMLDLGWDGQIDQVKEKFGGLRFYVGAASDEVFEVTMQMERESLLTCEECGAQGEDVKRHHGFGWMITHCHECNEKRRKDEGQRDPIGD